MEEVMPVPLEKIALYLGFTTAGFSPNSADLAKVSGMIDYAQNKIFINTSESLPRQRFTLAHEIGHAYLHKENAGAGTIVDFRAELDAPSSPKEVEANQFAAALLMPLDVFVRRWLALKGDVEQLAKAFVASRQAVQIRVESTVNSYV